MALKGQLLTSEKIEMRFIDAVKAMVFGTPIKVKTVSRGCQTTGPLVITRTTQTNSGICSDKEIQTDATWRYQNHIVSPVKEPHFRYEPANLPNGGPKEEPFSRPKSQRADSGFAFFLTGKASGKLEPILEYRRQREEELKEEERVLRAAYYEQFARWHRLVTLRTVAKALNQN